MKWSQTLPLKYLQQLSARTRGDNQPDSHNVTTLLSRSASLDAGNVKLTYNALQEKAESKDKERLKEETKKLRKLEGDLRALFTEINVEESSSWTEVMAKIQGKEAFAAVTEAQAEKMFKVETRIYS